MDTDQIATLTLKVEPEKLSRIIAEGRLLEFADAVSAQAGAQITAQLVQHAVEPGRLEDAAAVVQYVTVVSDGEPGFGTPVPRPVHFPGFPLGGLVDGR